MSRYIDAEQIAETYLQRARSEWRNVKEGNAGNAFAEASHIALHYPTADVQEVKHGHWVYDKGDCFPKCSLCGQYHGTLYEHYYCPVCGAKMDGDTE